MYNTSYKHMGMSLHEKLNALLLNRKPDIKKYTLNSLELSIVEDYFDSIKPVVYDFRKHFRFLKDEAYISRKCIVDMYAFYKPLKLNIIFDWKFIFNKNIKGIYYRSEDVVKICDVYLNNIQMCNIAIICYFNSNGSITYCLLDSNSSLEVMDKFDVGIVNSFILDSSKQL